MAPVSLELCHPGHVHLASWEAFMSSTWKLASPSGIRQKTSRPMSWFNVIRTSSTIVWIWPITHTMKSWVRNESERVISFNGITEMNVSYLRVMGNWFLSNVRYKARWNQHLQDEDWEESMAGAVVLLMGMRRKWSMDGFKCRGGNKGEKNLGAMAPLCRIRSATIGLTGYPIVVPIAIYSSAFS